MEPVAKPQPDKRSLSHSDAQSATSRDKFKAVWVSHSSIADFLKCPRLYYLRNVYKDPRNNHKFTIMSPPLALGQAVHDVIESLSTLPTEERLKISLLKRFETVWEKVSGEKGGFLSKEDEEISIERGKKMLQRIIDNPGPISKKAIKIKHGDGLPYYWLSEEENIILCGKIDWIEYFDDDSVHIIDFKTGKHEEDSESLQLPIYTLLSANTQKRKVSRASYWYLDRDDVCIEMKLPDASLAFESVMEVAKRMKLARQINHFKCPKDGCFACRPFERVLKGEGRLIGVSSYGQDIYIL
jgi:ATP-dependent helicase/DNAse subunit B